MGARKCSLDLNALMFANQKQNDARDCCLVYLGPALVQRSCHQYRGMYHPYPNKQDQAYDISMLCTNMGHKLNILTVLWAPLKENLQVTKRKLKDRNPSMIALTLNRIS